MACELSIAQIVEATGGVALSSIEKLFVGVGTDTRQALDNKIFIALKGDQFDAHNYLAQALQRGALCLMIHNEAVVTPELLKAVTVIKVPDTLLALQDLAHYWRKKCQAIIVGITGSNGKTTTKEYAKAILETQFKVHSNVGSYNNHWGVPLTLLGISPFHEVALLEMGMNHAGELTTLSKIAEPDVVLCTTVGRGHIGNFNGSNDAVADAKEEIYIHNPKAIKIFNYDNEYTIKMFERASQKLGTDKTLVFSSFSAGSEVGLRANHMSLDGLQIIGQIGGVRGEARVPVFGRHNVVNLMAASCIGLVMQMEPERIWRALPMCKAQWGRGQLLKLPKGTSVLFDAYNANPESMAALVKNLFEINAPENGKKVAVLGEMLELGDSSPKLHMELGETVGQTDFDVVWFMGPSSDHFLQGIKNSGYSKKIMISASYEESLANNLSAMLNPQDIVVVKGSRGMRLERVLQLWDPLFVTK